MNDILECKLNWLKPEYLHPNDRYKIHWYKNYLFHKYEISKFHPVNSIIEIGVCRGYSALAFLIANPNAKFIGFDDCSVIKDSYDWAKRLLANYDVLLWAMNTQETNDLGCKAEFIHVDGDHSYNSTLHDLELALKSSTKYILIDDYLRIVSVKNAVDEFLTIHKDLNWKFYDTLNGDVMIYK